MTDRFGLFLPNGVFHSFAELNEDRSSLALDLATRETAGESWLAGLSLLPDPDPVLRKRGEDATILEALSADDQVCSAMQTRKIKTLNKLDYTLAPGARSGEEPTAGATRLCRDLESDLERVDLLSLFSEVLDAPYYGWTVVELQWRYDAGRMRLADVVAKPRRWFGFDSENALIFKRAGVVTGEPVTSHKTVLARHFPSYDNPYGLRLLSRCLWPVVFKRGGVKFWTTFCEKFGLPWVVGRYEGSNDAERRAMLANLSTMVQDAVAVISGKGAVDIHETSGKSGTLHQDFVRHWDGAIAKILMGQTLTSDDGGGKGSYALGGVHYAVLDDYAQADETLVVTFMNDVAWTYTQVNAPAERSPEFSFVQPEDHAARANLDVKLKKTGVRFTKAHYVKTYGMAEEEFEVEGTDGAGADGPELAAEFAEAEGSSEADHQKALEGMIATALPVALRVTERSVAEIMALIDKAESYEDMQILLAEAMTNAGDDELEQALQEVLVAADLYGRWSAQDGGHER